MVKSLPKVTILTARSGGGHMAAAQSLTEALAGRAEVTLCLPMDEHTPFPIRNISAAYAPLVNRAPALYYAAYRVSDSRRSITLTERVVLPFVADRVSAALQSWPTDLWISVHPLHVDSMLWLLRKNGDQAPFVTVVTDPVTVHAAWFSPNADLTVVATEAARRSALACGVPDERVRVLGLPIRQAFGEAWGRPKPQVRALLGLAPEQPLVLMSGGGAGIGRLPQIARAVSRSLAQYRPGAQMAIIAGRNAALEHRLAAEKWPGPVTVLGFVENMADWLAAADLFITKAGPGALAEAACLGVPVIITDAIPGQEQGNVTWTVEHGAGVFEADPERIAARVVAWLAPGSTALAEMSAAARGLAQPDAARRIADAALALLG